MSILLSGITQKMLHTISSHSPPLYPPDPSTVPRWTCFLGCSSIPIPLPWLLSYWEMLLNIPYVIRWGQDAVSGWPPPIAAARASLMPKRFITVSWGSWVPSIWVLHVDALHTFIDNKNTFLHWAEAFSNPHQDIPCVSMYKIYWSAMQSPQDLDQNIWVKTNSGPRVRAAGTN